MFSKEKSAHVKKETLMVVAFVALAVGFLGGVFYSSYRSSPLNSQQPTGQARVSTEETSMLSELMKETERHPENVAAWVQLGNLYFDADQFDKAINAYNRALALSPENGNVLTDLGVMYRRKGLPEEAIRSFDRAIEVNPLQEAAYFNKGVVYLHDLKDRDKAIRAWEELVKVNPVAKVRSGELVSELIETVKSKKP